jgi:methyltransferase (TIGR00027 family)
LIARSILLASKDQHRQTLVAKGEADLLHRILTSGQRPDRLVSALEWTPVRGCLLSLERILLPGIITHYLARKRQIESEVERAIAHGCRRVVVIAAGYDTLACRLYRRHPDVTFIELDHPATQQIKRREVADAPNLHFQPIDLVTELPSSALSKIPTKQDQPTTFVIEGLTMYLPAKRVAELLTDLSILTGTKGSIVFTFMEEDASGSIAFRGGSPLIARWLQARSEPFLWGISRDKLAEFLQSAGLGVVRLFNHESLRREQLQPRKINHLPIAEGELICIASPIS